MVDKAKEGGGLEPEKGRVDCSWDGKESGGFSAPRTGWEQSQQAGVWEWPRPHPGGLASKWAKEAWSPPPLCLLLSPALSPASPGT